MIGNVIQPNGAVSSGGFNKTLISTHTIARSDFGSVSAAGRRTAEVNLTSIINKLFTKNLLFEIYETNYFDYWKKANIMPPTISFAGYFEQGKLCVLNIFGDDAKYYTTNIGYYSELNTASIQINVLDTYYSNQMATDSNIVINIYELS